MKKNEIKNLIEKLIRETENRNILWDVETTFTSMEAVFLKKITEFKKLKIDVIYDYKYDYNAYLKISFIYKNIILYNERVGVIDDREIRFSLKKLVSIILKVEEEDRQFQ